MLFQASAGQVNFFHTGGRRLRYSINSHSIPYIPLNIAALFHGNRNFDIDMSFNCDTCLLSAGLYKGATSHS